MKDTVIWLFSFKVLHTSNLCNFDTFKRVTFTRAEKTQLTTINYGSTFASTRSNLKPTSRPNVTYITSLDNHSPCSCVRTILFT